MHIKTAVVFSALFLLCIGLLSCTSHAHLSPTPPPDLPDNIYFRTATESFNRTWYLALRNGIIWYKDNEETTGKKSGWRIFGKTGKPEKKQFDRFGTPSTITSISADGIHLMALSESGIFYRGTNLTNNPQHGFTWNDKWGWWAAGGPGLKNDIKARAWSVSDAFPLDLGYYEDGNNNRHATGLGVAHLYALSVNGTKIYYNDWWLPADWSRQFAGPLRGTFVATNMSASGSTIFVVGEDGRMFTRMYDFDMNGENSLLTYSYVKTGKTGTTRKLPMPDWQQQPPVTNGNITSKITIFQTGKGNAARVVRVEGEQNGKTGFFYKNIFDTQWNFRETHQPITQPFLTVQTTAPDTGAIVNPMDKHLVGTLTRKHHHDTLELEFLNFNIACPPAKVRILSHGEPIMTNGRELTFTFYHTQTLTSTIRPPDFWDKGIAGDFWGALVFPDSLYYGTSIKDKKRLRIFFGKRRVVNFVGKATRETIDMYQISGSQKNPCWVPFFVVPANEKGNRSGYHLRVGP